MNTKATLAFHAFAILTAILAINAAAEDVVMDADGVQIRFIVEGQGQAVVLLHGFAANAEMNWITPGIVKALSGEYRVIAIDFRGHGKSDKPHRDEAYGLEMVNDVIRILDHLNIDRAHVAGYSMGGFVAMKLMAEHPDRVNSVVLGGSGGVRDDFDHGWNSRMAKELEAGVSFVDAMQKSLPDDEKMNDETIALMKRVFIDLDNEALAAVLRSWKQLSVSYRELEKNRTPALVIYGSQETAAMRTYFEQLKGRMGKAEFHAIDGADHLTTVTHPQFRESIRKFFSSHARKTDASHP